jgi:toxin ParE1/3/4
MRGEGRRADDQVRKIVAASRLLSNRPLSGRARDTIIPRMGPIVAAPYVIFYRVSDEAVEIVRFGSGAETLKPYL